MGLKGEDSDGVGNESVRVRKPGLVGKDQETENVHESCEKSVDRTLKNYQEGNFGFSIL